MHPVNNLGGRPRFSLESAVAVCP